MIIWHQIVSEQCKVMWTRVILMNTAVYMCFVRWCGHWSLSWSLTWTSTTTACLAQTFTLAQPYGIPVNINIVKCHQWLHIRGYHHCHLIGPIPWGHSGPLCHALSLSSSSSSLWTSMRRRRATEQWQHLVNWREAARCGERAQHFSNASCYLRNWGL